MAKSLLQQRLEAQKARESQASDSQARRHPEQMPEQQTEQQANQQRLNLLGHVQLSQAPSPYREQEFEQINEQNYEDEMVTDEMRSEMDRLQHEETMHQLQKVFQVILSIVCVYMIFLIYGLANTNYTYNNRGEVVPQVMTVQERKEVAEFETMRNQYIQARALYERALVLDYRLATQIEDPLLIAPEYEALLDDISSLAVQIGAITTPARYVQTMNMLLSWVQNDIALYCQNMSAAISQNNAQKQSHALTDRQNMYNDFKTITQNIATLGSTISNVDMQDIVSWSPEGFVQKYIGEGN